MSILTIVEYINKDNRGSVSVNAEVIKCKMTKGLLLSIEDDSLCEELNFLFHFNEKLEFYLIDDSFAKYYCKINNLRNKEEEYEVEILYSIELEKDIEMKYFEVEINRGYKTKLSSGFLSFDSSYINIEQSRKGNAYFDKLKVKLNDNIDMAKIRKIIWKIESFYSFIHGYICYSTHVFCENNSGRYLFYQKHKYIGTKKVDWFNESNRFNFEDSKVQANQLFEKWLKYDFENKTNELDLRFIIMESLFFHKADYSPVTMYYKDIFSFFEEVCKAKHNYKKESKLKDEEQKIIKKINEYIVDSKLIEKNQLIERTHALFDPSVRKAIRNIIEKYQTIFNISNSKQRNSLIDAMIKVRNPLTHAPTAHFNNKNNREYDLNSFIIVIREILIIEVIEDITGYSLINEYNKEALRYFDNASILFK